MGFRRLVGYGISRRGSAALLTRLEAENANLRHRAAELALDVQFKLAEKSEVILVLGTPCMDDVERLPDQISVRSAEQSHDEELSRILSEMIATVSRARRQLRLLVYEFARRRLRTSLYAHFEDGNWAEIQKQLKALDTVIDKVETNSAHNTSLTFMPEPPLTYRDLTNGPIGELSIPKAAITFASSQRPLLAQTVGAEDRLFVAVRANRKTSTDEAMVEIPIGRCRIGAGRVSSDRRTIYLRVARAGDGRSHNKCAPRQDGKLQTGISVS